MVTGIVARQSDWAVSLAQHGSASDDKLSTLLELCRPPDAKSPSTTRVYNEDGDVVGRLIPLVQFLEQSVGKTEAFTQVALEQVHAAVLSAIPQITLTWTKPTSGDPLDLESMFTTLFSCLHSILRQKEVVAGWHAQLSKTLGQLFVSLFQVLQPSASTSAPPRRRAPVQLLLRSLTRFKPTTEVSQAPTYEEQDRRWDSTAGLPLLPDDALVLLEWLCKRWLQTYSAPPRADNMEPYDGDYGRETIAAFTAVTPQGTLTSSMAPAAKYTLRLDNDKTIELVTRLVRTVLSCAGDRPFALGSRATQVFSAVTDWTHHAVHSALLTLLGNESSVATADDKAAEEAAPDAVHIRLPNPGATSPKSSTIPTGAVLRAAAQLGAAAMRGLDACIPPEEARTSGLTGRLTGLLDELLDFVEAAVAAADRMGPQEPSSQGVLAVAAFVMEEFSLLVPTTLKTRDGHMAGLFARLRVSTKGAKRVEPESVMLSTAAMLPLESLHTPLNGREQQPSPFTPATAAAASAAVPALPHLGNVQAGAATTAVAAAARASSRVNRQLEWSIQQPLFKSAARSKAPGWGAQRLCCTLAEALCQGLATAWAAGRQAIVASQLTLPETSGKTSSEQKVTTQVLGRLFLLTRCDQGMGELVMPLLMDALVSGRSALQPRVYACMVKTLAGMAAGAAREVLASDWAYNQVVELLLRLYREPTAGVSALLMAASARQGAIPWALADAVTSLAEGLRAGSAVLRMDLRLRLLTLFSDLGLRSGSEARRGTSLVTDIGALLPAIATACEGLEPSFSQGSLQESGRLRCSDIQRSQRDDGSLIKLLRNFWLYAALFRLTAAAAPPEWRAAAGRIAAVTPPLLAPLGTSSDMDSIERLKIAFGDCLAHAGVSAEPTAVRESLLALLGPLAPPGKISAVIPGSAPTSELVFQAYLLTTATCELARVSLGPLPRPEDPSPIAIVLACVQTASLYVGGSGPTEPAKTAAAPEDGASWHAAIAERVFEAYIEHVAASQAVKSKAIASTDTASVDAASAMAMSCYEGLAVTLIKHLGGSNEEACSLQVIQLSDRLLRSLLDRVPGLYWSQGCVQALLGALQVEEGDHPLGALHQATDVGAASTAWPWLRSWILTAAQLAPSRAEALVHHALGPVSVASQQGRSPATAAAARRASDLLAICAEARRSARKRDQAAHAIAHDASEGTLALCRKQYYAGLVAGMKLAGRGSNSSTGTSSVALQLSQALDEALHQNLSMAELEERYLASAALLASSSSGDGLLSSAAGVALLKSLVSVPLSRFDPGMTSVAVFAWNWVLTAAPDWLVPLTSRLVSAWCWTVDQRIGLFHSTADAETISDAPGEAVIEDLDAPAVAVNGPGNALGGGSTGIDDEARLLEGVQTHHAWLTFFSELEGTLGERGDVEHTALSQVFDRLLHHSLQDPVRLCSHPAAAGARFRLLTLALQRCHYKARKIPRGAPYPPALTLLHDKALQGALAWFYASPPAWSARLTQWQAQEEVAAIKRFLALLEDDSVWPPLTLVKVYDPAQHGAVHAAPLAANGTAAAVADGGVVAAATAGTPAAQPGHPVWGSRAGDTPPAMHGVVALLAFLCRSEVDRLEVWAQPLERASLATPQAVTSPQWRAYVHTAWQVAPQLAVALVQRFSAASSASRELELLLQANAFDTRVQAQPGAALLLATEKAAEARHPSLAALATWAPASAAEGLELISGAGAKHPGVKAYAIRCLENSDPQKVAFFLPQLVQSLRHDSDALVQAFFLSTARRSDLFAHQLIWALQTEEEPPEEAFNPEVKRSGWQAPKDCGLWKISSAVRLRVLEQLSPSSRAYWEAESGYFDQVNRISGILKKYPKDERRAHIAEELAKFGPNRQDLYIPTNTDCKVLSHIPSSGTPMQSAAKVPILVAFNVQQEQPAPLPPLARRLACIFKVGDDCRQDVLALQVIRMLRDAFSRAGLGLYLCPYGVLPTGYECGIIEVVPNTKSRAAMGELSDRGLYEIFQAEFGAPGSPGFEAARRNFIVSEAGYAIASFILQAKDRHNGNLLIDADGHLVHIDFGFILEISPGGNIGFESAGFKLSHEMTQLVDPGGHRRSAHFRFFEELCVRGYLVARTVAEPIIATVALMEESGLPCFGRGAPITNLRSRFHLEMSDRQAAHFIRGLLADAYAKWTTGVYDFIQAKQNRIPY